MPNLSVRAIRYGRTDEVILKYTILCFFKIFLDLLIIGKRKGGERVMVQDYCPRNMLQVSDSHPITGR